MTPEECTLITGLFDRLRTADANAPAKDREAEELIRQLTAQAPSAPYLLTQTLLVQEHALTNAQTRIQALERQVAQAQQQAPAASSGGSFLSGLFGHHSTPPPAVPPQQTPPPMPIQSQTPPPYPSTVNMAPSSGGGFLRNALTTAAGVAGGAMLFQGIENLLGHNAGPFGSGLGNSGGFMNSGPREVVNNYYNDAPSGGHEHSGGGAGAGDYDSGGNIPAGAADQPAHPGYEDARFDDSNFDKSNPFDQPANDSSFLGTAPDNSSFDQPTTDSSFFNAGTDNSSLDNNYDLGNTDASSSDFGGGGDFAGSDNSDNGDSGAA